VKRALLAAALAVGLGAMALTGGGPPAAEPPVRVQAPAPPARQVPVPPLTRNPFEFAGRRVEQALTIAPASGVTRAEAPSPPPLPAPVRLAGFVRRGEGVKAVLIVEGDAVLLGQGESTGGYTLLSVDETEGVRLTTPDGSEIGLPVPD